MTLFYTVDYKLIGEFDIEPIKFTGIKEYNNGTKVYLQNGLYHRTDGPAVEYSNGSKEWFLNGKRHRIDGPAFEKSNGDKQWWVNHFHIKNEEQHKLYVDIMKLKGLL